ncbi:DNA internalization-related competence protein ComEC/Rec2 [Candidatus Colwellia aromaticivorans]|uniref:DNA internalization-related competence protein ComEC/Rec2 n=1 Tax=Candidatus Colwellia aromaticivorans TaxID=2267621 RepID=UPI000DF44157|nr:DNA internalization-related competence protein ComEC/Rec2 [Candidatus Colwellia aromaticivorans]
MDWWLASFFLGSILSLFIPIVPDLFVLFLLISLSITFFSYKPLRLSSGLFFGASWMLFNAFNYQSLWQENNLNSLELAEAPQWVQGKVSSLQSSADPIQINRDKKPLRFNLNVTHLNSKKLNTIIKIRLSWKNAKFAVQQGQVVKLKVKFKPAHGLANIGGFSYQTWLRSKRILATGYVVNDKNNNVLMKTNSIRQQLFNTYKSLLPEHDLSPLLLALGFGSRSELNQELWQVLQTTGTGHLIAISGLHIGLVATGSYFFIMLIIRLLPLSIFNHLRFFQTINIRYFVITVSLGVGIIYGYLAGFSLPTIRALLMLSIYWFSRTLSLHISIKRWLLLTLFLLTLMTPFSLFTASFWLSVYAVSIIFLTLWRFKNMLNSGNTVWRFIKGLFVIQLSLTVMLLPISAVFFQQVSLVALLANIIAVPWMSFFSIPLCLLSVLVMPFSESISQFLMAFCIDSLQALWHYLSYLSQQTWAVVKLSNMNIQLLVLLGIMSVFYLFFQLPIMNRSLVNYQRKYVKKLFVGINVSILLFFTLNIQSNKFNEQESTNDTNWQLVVFDVGQGLSVLIQRGTKTILYDTGAAYPSGFTMANAVILPYLQHSGVAHLDKMIISHSDNDHAGGLIEIQESMVINELIYNDKQTTKNAVCLQGKSFVWQNLHFEMLWPKSIVSEENDDSCVLLISDGKHNVLLTGDISKKVEAALLQQYPDLNTDILVVPHHGSKTSSSDLFITTLQPAFAVVSAGYLNRWRMPVVEVVQRYQQHNVKLLSTAKSGQIIFTLSEHGINKQSYYRDLWPFWFAH